MEREGLENILYQIQSSNPDRESISYGHAYKAVGQVLAAFVALREERDRWKEQVGKAAIRLARADALAKAVDNYHNLEFAEDLCKALAAYRSSV